MEIRSAVAKDKKKILKYDCHIHHNKVGECIYSGLVDVLCDGSNIVGVLRWNMPLKQKAGEDSTSKKKQEEPKYPRRNSIQSSKNITLTKFRKRRKRMGNPLFTAFLC